MTLDGHISYSKLLDGQYFKLFCLCQVPKIVQLFHSPCLGFCSVFPKSLPVAQ